MNKGSFPQLKTEHPGLANHFAAWSASASLHQPWLRVLTSVVGGAVLGAITLSLFPILIVLAIHLSDALRR